MIKGGFYIKARCISESAIATAPPHFREVWDYLLRTANFKDKQHLKRGQLVTSAPRIREELHWLCGARKEMYNKVLIENAMKWLRSREMITTAKTVGGVIVTVCNYDVYQNKENYESRTESQSGDHAKAGRKPNDINKNDKNVNRKNINILLSKAEPSDLSDKNQNYLKAALWFQNEMLKNHTENQNVLNAKAEKWTNCMRMVLDNDKRDKDEVVELVEFAVADLEFWASVLQSPSGLRKNYEKIKASFRRKQTQIQPQTSSKIEAAKNEYDRAQEILNQIV